MTRLLSWTEVILFTILVIFATFFITRMTLAQQAPKEKEVQQVQNDGPVVHISKPEQLPVNEKISNVSITCSGEEMAKGCTMEISEGITFTLQDAYTLPDLKNEDVAGYGREATVIDGRIYITAEGGSAMPGGGEYMEIIYEYDQVAKSLKKLFVWGSDSKDMSSEDRNSRGLVYLRQDITSTTTAIYRDVVVNGRVQSSLVATTSNDGEWQLGADCREVAPCFGWQKWATILDENNIVLGFEKIGTTSKARKYVYIPLN
jgi:hypothetical protein